MVNGFFPTPHPDECLYSILCRYYARCGGAGYESISQLLFGKLQNLAGTIYLPIKAEHIDYWAFPETGITRASIALKHTMYPYFAMSYTTEFRAEIERVLNDGVPPETHDRTMSFKSRRSWLTYLRYCPLCVAKDNAMYGEAYWHRKHQLPGSYFCTKHQIRIVNSHVTVKQATTGFYPASSETQTDLTYTVGDIFDRYKEKCLKISQESEWLLENGLSVDWQENGREKYVRLFRDNGIASVNGFRYDSNILNNAVNDYWGSDFLSALFSETPVFPEWLSRIHANMMSRFLPLQHILLMCFTKGSVHEFVNSGVSENPFGIPPFMCENPICSHYHVDGAVCTEVHKFESRAVGHFYCGDCGMRYKISKAKSLKGITVITDYGHLWDSELRRCCQDPKITNEQTANILKCSMPVLMLQKKKRGLLEPFLFDEKMGAEKYYKSQVEALCEEYGEVTIALLEEKVPGAYSYLGDHHKKWLYEHIVFVNETKLYLERKQTMLKKVREAVEHITALNNVKRQITYGYIAEISGFKRDELRSNSHIRNYLDGIIESKEDWHRRRIITAYCSKPINGKPYTALEICRAASIELNTFIKYQEFFEEVVRDLNADE